jgi:uncharacterized phage-associated protein
MLVSRDREKLLNALIYFIRETKHAHTLKLFKLLNLLDFEHFRQTGRTVTGLDYEAFKNGPVPRSLWKEFQHGGNADLRAAIAMWAEKDEINDAVLRRVLKPRVGFDPKYFTKRELKIMERLAFFFQDFKAEDMTEFSHGYKKPWTKIWDNGKGKNATIPPELSLESDPIISGIPNIPKDDLELRKELLRDIA